MVLALITLHCVLKVTCTATHRNNSIGLFSTRHKALESPPETRWLHRIFVDQVDGRGSLVRMLRHHIFILRQLHSSSAEELTWFAVLDARKYRRNLWVETKRNAADNVRL